jgi:hypothetical protein
MIEPSTMGPAAALWGTAGLAGLQEFLLGPAGQQALRQALATLLKSPEVLESCHLVRAKFKPGRKLSAYYEVELPCTEDHQRRRCSVAAGWRPQLTAGDAPPPGLAEMQAEAAERGLAAPFRQLHGEFPALGLVVQVSPLDPAFPQLVRVCDPRHVRRMIEAVCVTPAARPAAGYTVTAVRYRPGQRHVLRYDPLDAAAGHQDARSVFAKLYEDGMASARALRVATRVADWLAMRGTALTAARPLRHVPDDAVILYPRLTGVPLSEYFRQRGRGADQHLRQAGLMLRTLHQEPGATSVRTEAQAALHAELRDHTLASETKAIARTCEHIRVFLPAVGARVSRLLDQAQRLYERLPQEAPAFAHGDFKADHLWVHEAGLTLMDFDTCYLADPAIDVGKFLSDLQWWAAVHGRDAAEQAPFLDAYAAGVPPERLLRARIFEALVLVKSTAHRVPLFATDWASRTEQLISRAENALRRAEL